MELWMCMAYKNWYDPFQPHVMKLVKHFAWMLHSEALVTPDSLEQKNGDMGSKDK